ncbi:hypothetical protein BGW41_008222 [Actinomortierella wolfii]|nr:hypothetical protein BGW41_008222 [Actinomortierella wolfii]
MKVASSIAILAISLVQFTWANIDFNAIPSNSILKPRDKLNLTWRYLPTVPPPETANLYPIDFYLKSDLKEIAPYHLQKGVNQQQLSIVITIPNDVYNGRYHVEADYTVDQTTKSERTSWFNITGGRDPPPPSTTAPPGASGTSGSGGDPTGAPNSDAGKNDGGGLSAGALAGIIGGVIVLLLAVALIFACRYRRRSREAAAESRGMDDKKSIGGDYSSKDQDKEVLTMSPVHNEPVTPPGAKGEPYDKFPPFPPPSHPQHQQQQHPHQQQFQNMHGGGAPVESLGGRSPRQTPRQGPANPFESEQDHRMQPQQQQGRMPPGQGVSPRMSPRMPHHQYEPPALPPHLQQQQQQHNHMQGRPGMGSPTQQSPFHDQNGRRSFESEVESAYDPARMRSIGGYPGGAPVRSGSSSSSRMPPDPRQLHQARSQQDLRAEAQSHEERQALAAAVAAASASPTQTPRQPYSPSMQNRQLERTASGRMREIEMQPLEIQQHHLAQQQKVAERQQRAQSPLVPHQKLPGQVLNVQQQSGPSSPPAQQHAPVIPSPLANNAPVVSPQPPATQPQEPPAAQAQAPAPAQAQAQAQAPPKFDPTQYDDKAEIVDEDDESRQQPYNGYRDTIFGAYADVRNNDSDSEDSSDDALYAVPAVPPTITSQSALQGQQQQQPVKPAIHEEGAQVQRKKSVKFTGVPTTGPIVLDGPEAAAQHQAQRQQRLQEQQKQSSQYNDDSDDSDDEDNNVKHRMMETEANEPLPKPTHPSPYQNDELSPSLDNVAAFGSEDGFYEDVLAAVEKSTVSPPPSISSPAPAPPKPTSQPLQPAPSGPMPPPPQQQAAFVPPPPPPADLSSPTSAHVHQQVLPPPQPQHLVKPVEHESFGAPSPRMAPRPPALASAAATAAAAASPSSSSSSPYYHGQQPHHQDGNAAARGGSPTSPKGQAFPQPPSPTTRRAYAAPPPPVSNNPRVNQVEQDAAYENSLL